MPELIDRHALKNHLYRAQAEAFKHSEWYIAGAIQSFIDLLDKQPTIEPEVRHGRWDEIQCFSEHGIEMASYECTSCGNDIERQRGLVPPYCEFCGARMDGGADNG